ncbi:MAG: class I SAM-dependent methyltransferase [Hyphomicrobiales bacterium]|nr:MAG: class I SAM-dependent methyltransferase [Hyphomicrobiales bacterium]
MVNIEGSQNSSQIRSDYDLWHEQWGFSTENPLRHPWYASVFRELERLPGGRLLEVGCGRGEFSVWLARAAPRFSIVAVDFSGAAIDIAKDAAQKAGVAVEFRVADAEALPFESESFDVVVSCECMEHVASPQRMARELARVMKRGGRLCLTTPNQLNGNMISWVYAYLSGRPYNSGAGVQPRENFYFFWTVRRYLTNAGIEIDRLESSHYQWLLLPRVAPSKLRTVQFNSSIARWFAFPFGLHFSFFGSRHD